VLQRLLVGVRIDLHIAARRRLQAEQRVLRVAVVVVRVVQPAGATVLVDAPAVAPSAPTGLVALHEADELAHPRHVRLVESRLAIPLVAVLSVVVARPSRAVLLDRHHDQRRRVRAELVVPACPDVLGAHRVVGGLHLRVVARVAARAQGEIRDGGLRGGVRGVLPERTRLLLSCRQPVGAALDRLVDALDELRATRDVALRAGRAARRRRDDADRDHGDEQATTNG